jgi:hypothetical protein
MLGKQSQALDRRLHRIGETKMEKIDFKALMHLKACRERLTNQQYRTLRGQVLSGDSDGAMKGLRKLLKKND